MLPHSFLLSFIGVVRKTVLNRNVFLTIPYAAIIFSEHYYGERYNEMCGKKRFVRKNYDILFLFMFSR
jgi:hypothetical protein